jgi:hypothetical protein
VRLEVLSVATPPELMVPVPSAVVELQAEVGHLLKVISPVGVEGSVEALTPATVADSVTDWPEVGVVEDAARAVVVASVYWALPV